MRRARLIVLLTVSAATALPSAVLATSASATATPQRYIVVLDSAVADPGAVAREHAAATGAAVQHVYRSALKGYSAVIADDRVAQLRRDRRVAFVTGDAMGHLDAKPGSGSQPPPQLPTGIDCVDAGQLPVAAVDVDIAVMDTGIDGAHPDLDVVDGYWCGANSARGYDTDGHGHGTHVAGTAAARNNDIGVVGAAPGPRLWSLRIPDRKGKYYLSSYVCAVDWITARRDADGSPSIEAVNISMGITAYSAHFPGEAVDDCGVTNQDPLHMAICSPRAAGVTYVASAGNRSTDAQTQVPAGYAEVITVSALSDYDGTSDGLLGTVTSPPYCRAGTDDTAANFTNYGADVDLMAPGVCILSTTAGGGYGVMNGTSMAAPHVTGAAARLAAARPGGRS